MERNDDENFAPQRAAVRVSANILLLSQANAPNQAENRRAHLTRAGRPCQEKSPALRPGTHLTISPSSWPGVEA